MTFYALRLIFRTSQQCAVKIDRKGKTKKECKRARYQWAIDYLDRNVSEGWRNRTAQPKESFKLDASQAEEE